MGFSEVTLFDVDKQKNEKSLCEMDCTCDRLLCKWFQVKNNNNDRKNIYCRRGYLCCWFQTGTKEKQAIGN